MKKVFGLLAVLALVSMVSSAVWADPFNTHSAVATITASGTVEFSATLYKFTGQASQYSAPQSTGTISWDTSDVHIATEPGDWKTSQAYCLLKSTITNAGAKVVVYQDNLHNDTAYVATNDDGYGHRAGLVKANSGGGYGNFLDFQYYICELSSATASWVTTQPNFQRQAPDYYDPYASRGFFNKGDEGIEDSKITIATTSGIWHGNSDYSKTDHVMFFATTFKNVLSGESYGTQKIIFNTQVE